MPALRLQALAWTLVLGILTLSAGAEDLHLKKDISVGGSPVSSAEVWVKGARERDVTSGPTGGLVTIRQCDLKRTLTINEQSQAYLVANDAQNDSAAQAAALLGGPAPAPAGGTITQIATITDTGERKQISGYTARHLKTSVVVTSSANSCSQVSQKYDIDGWYADLAKEQSACAEALPPIRQADNCSDRVIVRRKGTAKPGYALVETITLHNDDSTTTKIDVATSSISKEAAAAELFDVPAGYREVKSIAELYGAAQPAQFAAQPMNQQQAFSVPAPSALGTPGPAGSTVAAAAQPGKHGGSFLSPMTSMAASMAGKGGMTGQAQQMVSMAGMQQAMGSQLQPQGMPGVQGMSGMQGQMSGASIPLPQSLGPKAPGKIRIGIAPAQAQLGQGNDAQNDYGTPVRNSIIYLMNGPSVEIAALDSRLPMQVQAEAQQKQCDYILMSGVTIKHGGGGFGKFMKAGNMAASMTPIGMMAHTAGAMAAAQAATMATQAMSQAAVQAAQQAATSQLSGLNGQIKNKDDVTVEYHLYPTGQDKSVLDNVLKGKAKSDGEDVMTPLMQQAANNVLTQVAKK